MTKSTNTNTNTNTTAAKNDSDADDHERLAQILQKNTNRGPEKAAGAAAPMLDPVTDESTAVIMTNASHRRYHKNANGKPACRHRSRREPDVWNLTRARAWALPCKFCYPDGDENEDSDSDAGGDTDE